MAQATGKPVKLLFTRRESMMVHPKRHATWTKVKLGAKKNGELLAAKTEIYGDTGAYASLGVAVMNEGNHTFVRSIHHPQHPLRMLRDVHQQPSRGSIQRLWGGAGDVWYRISHGYAG